MNDLCIYALLAFYALQPTSNEAMQPLSTFEIMKRYSVIKRCSVIALGEPLVDAKVRNCYQFFIIGENNPFFIRNKNNQITFTGPTQIVLFSANKDITITNVEQEIKNRYGLEARFPQDVTITPCGSRLSGQQNFYHNLQDIQLSASNFQEPKQNSPCRSLKSKL